MLLDDAFVGLGGVVADVGFTVGFKPQPTPVRHCIITIVVHWDAPVVPDGPAGVRVDAHGESSFPTAMGLLADAALAVGSFLCHL